MADIIFTDTLKCTATHGKLAKAAQIYDDSLNKTQGDINQSLTNVVKGHVFLGTFESSSAAESKAAEPTYAGNADINIMYYKTTDGQSGYFTQQVSSTKCSQMRFWSCNIDMRIITFTDSNRKTIATNGVGGWSAFDPIIDFRTTGMTNWGDRALQIYVNTIRGQSSRYILIPCVGYQGTSENGLMLYSDKIKLDKLNEYGCIATIASWSKLQALTTSSTSSEIVTALGMKDIDANKTSIDTVDKKPVGNSTYDGIDAFLSRAYKGGKYLLDRVTNSIINVSYLSSVYYFTSIAPKNVQVTTANGTTWVQKPCMKFFGLGVTYDSSTQTHGLKVAVPVESYDLYNSDIETMKSDIQTIKQKLNLTE